MIKKFVLLFVLLFAAYNYAQEVPGWIDTTKTQTTAEKYMSVSNAKPLPVKALVPILRLQDSLYHGAGVNLIYNLKGDYSYVEVAYTDTGAATDTFYVYVGICKTVGDTAWSRVGLVDVSDWNIDAEGVAGLSSTKQWWIKDTRITLLKFTLANTGVFPGQKGKIYLEAK